MKNLIRLYYMLNFYRASFVLRNIIMYSANAVCSLLQLRPERIYELKQMSHGSAKFILLG